MTAPILVTGGTGFLGLELCRALVRDGYEVASLARSASEELDRLGVRQIQGDVTDPSAVLESCRGRSVVLHAAALAQSKDQALIARVNVDGTRNVLDACRKAGVSRLVYTSSSAVVYGGGSTHDGTDETAPYPIKPLSYYGGTKAEAEKLVSAANGQGLTTVSLRLVQVLGAGNKRFNATLTKVDDQIIGDGTNLWDWVDVEDAANAHVLAIRRLFADSTYAGGVYFISDGQPIPFSEFVNRLRTAARQAPITRRVTVEEAVASGMRREVAEKLSGHQWHSIQAARRELGYEPRRSFEDVLGVYRGLGVQDSNH